MLLTLVLANGAIMWARGTPVPCINKGNPYGSGKANLFFIEPQQGKAGLYRSFIRLPSKSITSVIWPNIAGLIWTVVIVFG